MNNKANWRQPYKDKETQQCKYRTLYTNNNLKTFLTRHWNILCGEYFRCTSYLTSGTSFWLRMERGAVPEPVTRRWMRHINCRLTNYMAIQQYGSHCHLKMKMFVHYWKVLLHRITKASSFLVDVSQPAKFWISFLRFKQFYHRICFFL